MSNDLVVYQERALTKEEQLQHIYAEVASGRSLNRVLTEDDGMPSKTMFWGWHMRDEDVQNNLARARMNGVEALVDEAVEIANTPLMGEETMEEIGSDGVKRRRTRKEMLGHRRLQIDTRLKYAAMIAPRKYGPKLDFTSGGEKIALASAVSEGRKRLANLEQKDESND